ncbi:MULTISPECIES: hypothetical protein [unclassified Streptomyces]|uniref:hypothetical protein n=1 Tax=unclassified Streptomyces TaxID=2593676 RepID=UPI0033AE24BC
MTDTPRVPPSGNASAPSLRAYLGIYAAGMIERERMIATVASWPFEPEEKIDDGDTEPIHQDNTMLVVSAARLLGQLTRQDVEEIQQRIAAADRIAGKGLRP